MLLWAQECQPELSDKIQAIYDFCECPRIIEYADKFGYWQEAVMAVRHTLATAAKNTNAEIQVEVVDTYHCLKKTIKVRPNDDVRKLNNITSSYHAKITFRQQTLLPDRTIASYGIVDGSQVQVGS
ncbi:unnamed protein product [Caenorhabditis angaria]|uniref:Ubiquitin-like domain-containing protein n=1 Tax=Caenorhabditis angaria TaxID=860376 RepID=A0A9P1MUI4_9PELO|nr:unnamed protein product [Caenorhabditis angaria]